MADLPKREASRYKSSYCGYGALIIIKMGQFFSECIIGKVRHVGIHVYLYVPIVHILVTC